MPKTKRKQNEIRKPAPTDTGRRIQILLAEKGKSPGRYKDYVVILGDKLLDYRNTYNVSDARGETLAPGGVYLIHKRALHDIFPKSFADKFWRKDLGIRANK